MYVYMCVYVCESVCVSQCVCVHVCVCVCVHVCVCVFPTLSLTWRQIQKSLPIFLPTSYLILELYI